MYFRIFTLIYLLFALRLTAQDKGPEFLSRIRLSGEDAFKKEQILSGLKSLTLLSEEKEALEDIKKAKAHNSLLDTKDKEIETAILQLQNNASALAGLGGLLELRETISEQQKSRDKFQEEFEKQLQQNTKTKGLYLIVLPNTINEAEWDAKRFKSTAQQLLKSRAVKELNEVFISSLTEVVNRMEVSQRIRSRVSGSMLIEETPFEKRRPAAKDYVILQYLNVSPLTSRDEKSTVNGAESEIKALHLINCANEADVERTLKTLGLSAEDESALRGRINEYMTKAKDANVNSKGSISNMWTALNSQLEKLNAEIELARKTELEKNNQLRNLSEALCPEGMRSTQLKDSLQELHRKLDQYRVSITDKKREYEAGRFYLKEKLKITIGDGAPNAVISEGILKAVQDINTSYGNRSVYSEQVLVVDKMVQEAEIKGTVLRRGSLKDVWVHIHTGNEEYFVTLISRFEVNREKDTIMKEEPLKDPGNVVSEGATLKILSNVSGELKIDGISKGSIEKNNIKIFNDLKVGEYYVQLIPDNGWAVLSKKYTLNSGKAEILEFISSLPDRDGDGVTDAEDSCPDERGGINEKGCPENLLVTKAKKLWQNGEYESAFKIFEKEAIKGDLYSIAMLAYIYDKGLGVKEDAEKAFNYAIIAADKGIAFAAVIAGIRYHMDGKRSKGEYYFKIALDKRKELENTSIGKVVLGDLYYDGYICDDQDCLKESFFWYKKAAMEGDAYAQSQIGDFFWYGEYVRENHKEALIWHLKAADQGYSVSIRSLAFFYKEMGEMNESYFYTKKCAEYGDKICQFKLANMFYNGEGISVNFTEAIKWFRNNSDHPASQNMLGLVYFNGQGVTKDYSEAFNWFSKAAEGGISDAQFNLGFMYYHGFGVSKNISEAKKWFKKAADQGHEDAKNYLKS